MKRYKVNSFSECLPHLEAISLDFSRYTPQWKEGHKTVYSPIEYFMLNNGSDIGFYNASLNILVIHDEPRDWSAIK